MTSTSPGRMRPLSCAGEPSRQPCTYTRAAPSTTASCLPPQPSPSPAPAQPSPPGTDRVPLGPAPPGRPDGPLAGAVAATQRRGRRAPRCRDIGWRARLMPPDHRTETGGRDASTALRTLSAGLLFAPARRSLTETTRRAWRDQTLAGKGIFVSLPMPASLPGRRGDATAP